MPQDQSSGKNSDFLPQSRSIALISLGSNAKTRKRDATELILSSVESLKRSVGVIRGLSRIYRSPAFPPGSGPEFRNAVAVVETDLTAPPLLAALHDVEAAFGRTRTQRWGPRTLDLDLLALGAQVLPDAATQQAWVDLPLAAQMKAMPDQLLLPHPRMQDRAFVLVPLAEALAQAGVQWSHPVSGASVAAMLNALAPERITETQPLQ
jgi:2-amino-4-hydroxy-6-hydroxymethyldihydropteridine diphosphokinase